MEHVYYEGKVLWSQIDANMHLRHSAYADFAAQARLETMDKMGFDGALLKKLMIGPILFREELTYFKEIGINATIRVTCQLKKLRKDGSRWTFKQEIYRSDDVLAAQVIADGAWIDLKLRKLTALPDELMEKFITLPKTEDFVLEEVPEKKEK